MHAEASALDNQVCLQLEEFGMWITSPFDPRTTAPGTLENGACPPLRPARLIQYRALDVPGDSTHLLLTFEDENGKSQCVAISGVEFALLVKYSESCAIEYLFSQVKGGFK